MKLAALLIFCISTLAADIVTVTKDIGIEIDHCHPGDVALVYLRPLDPAFALSAGTFETKENILTWLAFTMMPDGTNVAEIRTVCRGVTSEVKAVTFILRRPPPAPKVRFRRLVLEPPTSGPPVPPGMVVALPDDQSRAYVSEQARIQSALRLQHRSQ